MTSENAFCPQKGRRNVFERQGDIETPPQTPNANMGESDALNSNENNGVPRSVAEGIKKPPHRGEIEESAPETIKTGVTAQGGVTGSSEALSADSISSHGGNVNSTLPRPMLLSITLCNT